MICMLQVCIPPLARTKSPVSWLCAKVLFGRELQCLKNSREVALNVNCDLNLFQIQCKVVVVVIATFVVKCKIVTSFFINFQVKEYLPV